jgi:uncharacterized surface protein with fasciclin (FAS1) repeats
MTLIKPIAAAAALVLIAPLAACSDGKTETAEPGAAETPRQTLATEIAGASNLTTVAGALSGAGLGEVFDGPGSYTVLAPDDEAFAALGDTGKTLTTPEHRAELVAILRGHILPGHLTLDAIRAAIADKKGPVSMRTLSDGMVTFSQAGDVLSVAGPDGAKATIDGNAIEATNGVVLPIDGLVKSAEPVAS